MGVSWNRDDKPSLSATLAELIGGAICGIGLFGLLGLGWFVL